MSRNIKVYKLVTGEEVVAEEISEEVDSMLTAPNYYEVINPVIAMLQPRQDGKLGIGLIPYMPYVIKGTHFRFRKEDIIGSVPMEVDEGLITQYSSMFQQILTPTKNLILG